MIRCSIIFIGFVCVLHSSEAFDNNVTIEEIYDMASNILNSTEVWQTNINDSEVEGRKSKFLGPFGFLPFQALWGFGGLHALGILFAIKLKIIIILSIVAFSVYYYTKILAARKCDHHEGGVYPAESYSGSSYFSSPITSYSSPFAGDIVGHSDIPYSGYHDSSLHSDVPSYTFDQSVHQDHHDHHAFEHHSHDFDQYISEHSTPISSDFPPGEIKDMSSGSNPSTSPTYRRVRKHRRRRADNDPQVEFIDFGELAFRFLGVDTDGCRKRFVCELDFRAKANPITRLAFSFIGRNFFERYRDSAEHIPIPQSFSDCSKIYNNCEEADKYNEAQEEENEYEKKSKLDFAHKTGLENMEKLDEREGSGDSESLNDGHQIHTHTKLRKYMNRKVSIV